MTTYTTTTRGRRTTQNIRGSRGTGGRGVGMQLKMVKGYRERERRREGGRERQRERGEGGRERERQTDRQTHSSEADREISDGSWKETCCRCTFNHSATILRIVSGGVVGREVGRRLSSLCPRPISPSLPPPPPLFADPHRRPSSCCCCYCGCWFYYYYFFLSFFFSSSPSSSSSSPPPPSSSSSSSSSITTIREVPCIPVPSWPCPYRWHQRRLWDGGIFRLGTRSALGRPLLGTGLSAVAETHPHKDFTTQSILATE